MNNNANIIVKVKANIASRRLFAIIEKCAHVTVAEFHIILLELNPKGRAPRSMIEGLYLIIPVRYFPLASLSGPMNLSIWAPTLLNPSRGMLKGVLNSVG